MTNELTRRGFVAGAAAGAASAGIAANPLLARALAGSRKGRRVAVLGGGMAGLTAAHELAERGFKVDVYEPVALGGKARSIGVPGTRQGRAQAASRRARLPVLPRLLPPRPGLDAPDPLRRTTRTASGTTSSTPPRASRCARTAGPTPLFLGMLYNPPEAFSPQGLQNILVEEIVEAEVAAAARGRATWSSG